MSASRLRCGCTASVVSGRRIGFVAGSGDGGMLMASLSQCVLLRQTAELDVRVSFGKHDDIAKYGGLWTIKLYPFDSCYLSKLSDRR
jgi:hypothetical protein